MIIYKCDGHRYEDGIKCESTYKVDDITEFPRGWISIDGSIKNDNSDAHIIEANGMHHYCSRKCLENSLFKNGQAKDIAKQGKLLKEAYTSLILVGNNFNLPTNIITEIEAFYNRDV